MKMLLNGHQRFELPVEGGSLSRDDFVFLCNNADCWVVRCGEIVSLEAHGNYTKVCLVDAMLLIRRPLWKCEQKLDANEFFRTGRDCVVNLGHVEKMMIFDPKRFVFVMADGREIILSRLQSVRFRMERAL